MRETHITNIESGQTFKLVDSEKPTLVDGDERHEFTYFTYEDLVEMALKQPKFRVKQDET